jgi:hypothetical protein
VQNSWHRGKGDNVLVIQQGAPNTSATLGAHIGKTRSSTCRHCHFQTQQQVINICTNFCEKGAISPPAIFQEIQEGAQVTSTDRQMHSSTGLPASKWPKFHPKSSKLSGNELCHEILGHQIWAKYIYGLWRPFWQTNFRIKHVGPFLA